MQATQWNNQGFPVLRSKGGRGLPAGAWGVPSFLPSFARRLRRRAKEKKKGFCGDTPHPGKGLPPSALLLDGRFGKPWWNNDLYRIFSLLF
ncbi:hypothetical protein KSF_020000 [Reticulibacter mediterranei]|uniref:Uncharacterized protein n=1 Tax=Reticulibacter mediterranei TaxID=2778369 RepID=A0A8J3N260_9CHLR|nr:hypothetical protein KSF_020000 [Reticulibacter mediterranei]